MRKITNKVLVAVSIVASVSAIASAPAQAGSLTNATIGGTAASDYYVYDIKYDINGDKTTKVDSNLANLNKVLGGNATNPTGNVELRASSETSGFDFTNNTSLSGTIGGRNITLSSLTASDWNSSVGNGLTFAQKWFNEALTASGFGSIVGSSNTAFQRLYNTALSRFNNGGRERFSDPNISYVNQDDNTNQIKIGLAGHLDPTSLLFAGLSQTEQATVNRIRTTQGSIQASEIVKVSYDNEPAQFLYRFNATPTELVAFDDNRSHNGNYEVTLDGKAPIQAVPEPSIMLGLLGVAGIFGVQRQRKKAQA